MFFVPLITSALWSAASRPYSFSENTLTAVDNICTVVRGFATVFIFLKILSQNRLLRSVVSRPSSCCASGISVHVVLVFLWHQRGYVVDNELCRHQQRTQQNFHYHSRRQHSAKFSLPFQKAALLAAVMSLSVAFAVS